MSYSSLPDDPDEVIGNGTAKELVSFDLDSPTKDDDTDAKELEPFKDFSSISEQHSTTVNTTLPLYYKRNSKENQENENSSNPVTSGDAELSSSGLETDNSLSETDTTERVNSTGNTDDNPTLEVDDIPSDADADIDAMPSPIHTPTELRSFSMSNGDVSPLLIRSIDQRFQTRLSSLTSVRSTSSNFSISSSASSSLNPSRNSTNNNTTFTIEDDRLLFSDSNADPWETVRWSKLRKISNQIFSESAQSAYGKPTCILAAAHIVLGMSHGHVLVFDYHQTLLAVLGLKTKAIECGQVTSLAVSADMSYIASGYSSGHIFTWDLAKPSTPNIHVRPLSKSALLKPKHSDGHVESTSVIYLNFMGKRHSALVSGDVSGMAFSHDTIRTVIGRTVNTKRILGRYPLVGESLIAAGHSSQKKPTTLLACSPLPLGNVIQPTDKMCLVAIMTPYLLAIVSVLPNPQTEFKTGRPKAVNSEMGLSGCVAWLPSLKPTSGNETETNARLAYSWSNVITIMEITTTKKEKPTNRKDNMLNFKFQKRYIGNESIVSIQWLSRQVSTMRRR